MIELKANQIAEATGGRLTSTVDAATKVTSANTDSRLMVPGSLFIARRGENTDGHNFISSARQAGATLILAERETTDEQGNIDPAVLVNDATTAMADLARYIVEKIRQHSQTTVKIGRASCRERKKKMKEYR